VERKWEIAFTELVQYTSFPGVTTIVDTVTLYGACLVSLGKMAFEEDAVNSLQLESRVLSYLPSLGALSGSLAANTEKQREVLRRGCGRY
jgi:hypothetical protein